MNCNHKFMAFGWDKDGNYRICSNGYGEPQLLEWLDKPVEVQNG